MATTSTSALFTRSWVLSNASGTPKRLPAASADSRRLVDSAVISKSSGSDLKAGMCACAAHPRSGLAPMMPTRILLALLLRIAFIDTVVLLMTFLASPSEPDRLPDEDDVDAAGILLVDLEDLADAAVHPVGGDRAGVLEFQAVLEDPLARRFQVGHELLRADDEDHVGGTPGVGGELAAGGGGDDERSVVADGMNAAERVVGLACDRLHLLQLRREVERHHPVARRLVAATVVDRGSDPGLLQRD